MLDTDISFKRIASRADRHFIIHYSSASLFDEEEAKEGFSPRITSIAVMHLSTKQVVSFALHLVAEELGIAKDAIESRFDEIEREMLERFYSFATERRSQNWIHWNMRDIMFGFEHLEHRYRVLTKNSPPSIPVEVRVDLASLLKERYGPDYARHPRMLKLMLLQGERDPRFLDGREEAEAFKTGNYIRMHSSTTSKVDFFSRIILLANAGRLKTEGSRILVQLDRLLDGRMSRVLALGASVVGVLSAIGWIVTFLDNLNIE